MCRVSCTARTRRNNCHERVSVAATFGKQQYCRGDTTYMPETRSVELPSNVFCGATVEVKVTYEDEVTGVGRVDWNREYLPHEVALIERVHWELRGVSYDAMSDAERARVDKKAESRAWELWNSHRDDYYASEHDMTNLDAAIKDAEGALREAVERHKGIYFGDLANAFDDDWRVKEASEKLYSEYADAAAEFLLDIHRKGRS